jgi:hypothetical protein
MWYQRMVVKIGTGCSTGNWSITTPNGTFTGPTKETVLEKLGSDFTVATGHTYYISTTGNDSTGTGSFSAPWLTPYHAKYQLADGDIMYGENGVTATTTDPDGAGVFTLSPTICGTSIARTFATYPGATVTIGTTSLDNAVRPNTNCAGNYVFSGITFRGQNTALDLVIYNSNMTNIHVVGTDISCPQANQETGCIQDGGNTSPFTDSGMVYLGNNLHDVGTGNNGLQHAIYHGDTFSIIDGWNTISNVSGACRGIQVYTSTANFLHYDVHLHDNIIHDTGCDGIGAYQVDASTAGKFTTGIEIYNNVIFNTGETGPGGADAACVYITAGVGYNPSGTIELFNNTLFNCELANSSSAGLNFYPVTASGMLVHMHNNIIYMLNASVPYYIQQSGVVTQLFGTNNLMFGAGAPPASTNITGTVNSNPGFVNTSITGCPTACPTNLQLAASTSPANKTGSTVAPVPTLDLTGLIRPSPPSIGAYEFSGAAPPACTGASPTWTLTFANNSSDSTNFQNCINGMSNGDTINTTGTTSTLTSITISNNITWNGQGSTTLNFGVSSTGATNIINVNPTTTGVVNITGITSIGSRINGGCIFNMGTTLSPLTQAWRIYNNIFNDGTPAFVGTIICTNGQGQSLIDHNTFNATEGADELIHNNGLGSANSPNGFINDITPGGSVCQFEENNLFNNNSGFPTIQAEESQYGTCLTFRYNQMNLTQLDVHAGSPAGGRWWEVYGNIFNLGYSTTVPQSNYWDLRGGSGVAWGNHVQGTVCCNDPNPGARFGPLSGSSDPQTGTWPLNFQVGRGINNTYSPAYAWGNDTLIQVGSGLVPPGGIGSTNTNYVQIGVSPTDATGCPGGGTAGHSTGVCDVVATATQPTTLLKCESAADVTAGCPRSYTYAPYQYPHPQDNLPTSCYGQGCSSGPTPPNAPTNLSASVTGSTPSLSWTIPTGSFTGETVYRGTTSGGPYMVVSSGLTGSTFTDASLPNNTYYYVVTAFNGGIITNVTGNGTTATATCSATCTFPLGSSVNIQGNSIAGFDGTFTVVTQPTPTTFTFANATNGTGTGGGAWQSGAESARSNQATAVVGATLTISFTPTSQTFPSTTVGVTTAAQTTRLTNTSSAGNNVVISSVTLTGTNPGDFAVSNNCVSGPPGLVSGQFCNINVTFTPTASGTRTATVSVAGTMTVSPQTYPVTGTGVSAVPIASLTPSTIIFGAQKVSTTSVAAQATLTNTGTGTLSVSSIATTGDFAVASTVPSGGLCGGTLAPNASCIINITFTPTVTGTRPGSLSVTDNAAGSPQQVTLSGTGINTKCAMVNLFQLSGMAQLCGP